MFANEINALEYFRGGVTAERDFTNNLQAALKTAMRVKSGYVWINGTSAHYIAMPFGGYRNSGTGREEGLEELLSYTEEKAVHVMLD